MRSKWGLIGTKDNEDLSTVLTAEHGGGVKLLFYHEGGFFRLKEISVLMRNVILIVL